MSTPRLGYENEWEVMTDMWENIFYRNSETEECVWERPIDAVEVTPSEQLCSAYLVSLCILLRII